jgi:hypothetical protein
MEHRNSWVVIGAQAIKNFMPMRLPDVPLVCPQAPDTWHYKEPD